MLLRENAHCDEVYSPIRQTQAAYSTVQ